jgi:hypothetical protein
MAEGTLAHPRNVEVAVLGDTRHVTVRKWKMRDRAELRPRLAALFAKVAGMEGQALNLGLAEVFMHAEEECAEIARVSTVMPEDLEWDDLDWEDLAAIVQTVWLLNVVGPDGGGLAGKVGSLLGPMLSTNPTESKPSGQDSACSPDGGAQPQSVSSTN